MSAPIRKVFWINFDASDARANHTRTFLAQHQLPEERIPGVHPDQLMSQADYHALVHAPDAIAKGNAGPSSFTSDFVHRRAYARIALEAGDDFYLIMEDDVKLSERFNGTDWLHWVGECLQQAPPDWGILRLGASYPGGEEDQVGDTPWLHVGNKVEKSVKTHKKVRYNGAHAIVLTPARARKLLGYIREHALSWADSWTGDSMDGKIKSYVLAEAVLVQDQTKYGSVRKDFAKLYKKKPTTRR